MSRILLDLVTSAVSSSAKPPVMHKSLTDIRPTVREAYMIGDVELSSLKGAMNVRGFFYDLPTDAKITQIAVAGERVWDGQHPLFNRRKSILSNERALQQLPRPDTLSSAP